MVKVRLRWFKMVHAPEILIALNEREQNRKKPKVAKSAVQERAAEIAGGSPARLKALLNAPWEAAKQTAEQKKLYGKQVAEQKH